MAKKLSFRQRFRARILWGHRWLGIISGLVVFVVSITGCMYVFEKECRELFQHKYYFVKEQHTPKKPLAELQLAVQAGYPKEKITSIRFKETADAAYLFSTKSRKTISVNPYTAAIIGDRNTQNDFFNVVLRLHRNLLLGKTGTQIIKWNVLIFFILCVSGLVIWWPKQKKFFRQAVKINFKTKNWKRLNWDLHSVLGFYALLLLMVISLTGIFWMFDSVRNGLKFVTRQPGSKKEEKLKSALQAGTIFSLDQAYTRATAMYAGASEVVITPPQDSVAPLRVTMQYPYTIVRKQNIIYYDQYSGEVMRENLYKNYTAYDKISRSNYQLHTGDMPGLGIGTKIIYFLASLISASLPITGFLVWMGRKKKAKKKIPLKTQPSMPAPAYASPK